MTRENRLKYGKRWYEEYEKGGKVKGIPPDHPYIKEYLASIPPVEEKPGEEKTKKKVVKKDG